MIRRAKTKDEATHRYPTSVYWGEGYFGDLMRYMVFDSDATALKWFAQWKDALGSMQRRTTSGWEVMS